MSIFRKKEKEINIEKQIVNALIEYEKTKEQEKLLQEKERESKLYQKFNYSPEKSNFISRTSYLANVILYCFIHPEELDFEKNSIIFLLLKDFLVSIITILEFIIAVVIFAFLRVFLESDSAIGIILIIMFFALFILIMAIFKLVKTEITLSRNKEFVLNLLCLIVAVAAIVIDKMY